MTKKIPLHMCIVHTCTYIDIHTYLFNNYLGDSTCGQRALYQMGLTGIPIFNVNNNCATGSSALHMANQVVSGGLSDCVLAVGFEKMQRGSLGSTVSCFIYEIIHIFQYVTNSWKMLLFSLMIVPILWTSMLKS